MYIRLAIYRFFFQLTWAQGTTFGVTLFVQYWCNDTGTTTNGYALKYLVDILKMKKKCLGEDPVDEWKIRMLFVKC